MLDTNKLASLLAGKQNELIAAIKATATDAAGACKRLGKAIFALDQVREDSTEKLSLARFIASKLPVETVAAIPRNAFGVANVLSGVGDGAGKFAEENFDAVPVRWCAVVSAIFNLVAAAVEKGEMDGDKATGYAEQVAVVIRGCVGKKVTRSGYDTLNALKKSLSPEKATGDEEGGDEDDEESGDEESEQNKALSALKFAAGLIAGASFDADQAAALAQAAAALASIVEEKSKAAALRVVPVVPVEAVPVPVKGKGKGKLQAAA